MSWSAELLIAFGLTVVMCVCQSSGYGVAFVDRYPVTHLSALFQGLSGIVNLTYPSVHEYPHAKPLEAVGVAHRLDDNSAMRLADRGILCYFIADIVYRGRQSLND